MEKYINPFTDFGFKKLFGTEPNKNLLIDFLNQVLPGKHQIKDLTYAPSEQLGYTTIDRKAVFDLYCIGENGDRFIVEMQKARHDYFKERTIFYSTFPIQQQAIKGEWDYNLSAVYTVAILEFRLSDDSGNQEVRHEIQLKDQNGNVFYNKFTLIYLEMPNFVKKEEELVTEFDKWMYVVKNIAKLHDRPVALQQRIFKQLFEEAEIAKFTPEEALKYQASLKQYRDLINTIRSSFNQGLEKGYKDGIEKGVEQGIEQGKKENARQLAIQMKKDNEPPEKIMRYTGLSSDEVAQL
jgi:predicted transposase/invertase (TIGR01784 family)